jgi:hypothetical protein
MATYTNDFQAAHTSGDDGEVRTGPVFSGLNPGDQIISVGVKVFAAAGNIRVKVYKDDGSGGDPSTLLGESNSDAISLTGIHTVSLISPAIVPASGKVWAAFEVDSALVDLYYTSGVDPVLKRNTHAYGTGPNPFVVNNTRTI